MKVGVRGSKLAIAYANKVVHALQSPNPIELDKIKTKADVHENKANFNFGGPAGGSAPGRRFAPNKRIS